MLVLQLNSVVAAMSVCILPFSREQRIGGLRNFNMKPRAPIQYKYDILPV